MSAQFVDEDRIRATPGPIYFGTGYVTQAHWWRVGIVVSVATLAFFSTVGVAWWKLIGLW